MLSCILEYVYLFSVSHTSTGADVVIMGGDLNMHPQDLGCRLLMSYTGLRDCYTETAKFDVGNSKNATQDNSFCSCAENIINCNKDQLKNWFIIICLSIIWGSSHFSFFF